MTDSSPIVQIILLYWDWVVVYFWMWHDISYFSCLIEDRCCIEAKIILFLWWCWWDQVWVMVLSTCQLLSRDHSTRTPRKSLISPNILVLEGNNCWRVFELFGLVVGQLLVVSSLWLNIPEESSVQRQMRQLSLIKRKGSMVDLKKCRYQLWLACMHP
jgi:hypothetical protein